MVFRYKQVNKMEGVNLLSKFTIPKKKPKLDNSAGTLFFLPILDSQKSYYNDMMKGDKKTCSKSSC